MHAVVSGEDDAVVECGKGSKVVGRQSTARARAEVDHELRSGGRAVGSPEFVPVNSVVTQEVRDAIEDDGRAPLEKNFVRSDRNRVSEVELRGRDCSKSEGSEPAERSDHNDPRPWRTDARLVIRRLSS